MAFTEVCINSICYLIDKWAETEVTPIEVKFSLKDSVICNPYVTEWILASEENLISEKVGPRNSSFRLDNVRDLIPTSKLTSENLKSLDSVPYEPRIEQSRHDGGRVNFVTTPRCCPYATDGGELNTSNHRIIDSESLERNTAQLNNFSDNQSLVSNSRKRSASMPTLPQVHYEECVRFRTDKEYTDAMKEYIKSRKAEGERAVAVIDKKNDM
jgi:hypothetical protein